MLLLSLALTNYGMVKQLIPQPGEPTPPIPPTVTVGRGKKARATKHKPQVQSQLSTTGIPEVVIQVMEDQHPPSDDLLTSLPPESNAPEGNEYHALTSARPVEKKAVTDLPTTTKKHSSLEYDYTEFQRVVTQQQTQIEEMASELAQLRKKAEEAERLAEELAFCPVPRQPATSTPYQAAGAGGDPSDPDSSDSDDGEAPGSWSPYNSIPSRNPAPLGEAATGSGPLSGDNQDKDDSGEGRRRPPSGPPGGSSGPPPPPNNGPGRDANHVTSITHHPDGNVTYRFQEEAANINVTVPQLSMQPQAVGQDLERIAKEFRKSRDPKVAKFKGGSTSDAMLRLNRWLMDLEAVKVDKGYTDLEMIRVAMDSVEDLAEQELLFYLETNKPTATYEGLINHMKTAFCCCEDPLLMQADFYGREQRKGESVDKFASALQILGRKLLFLEPNYTQVQIDEQLKKQFANHLADNMLKITAKTLLSSQPNLSWPEFRKHFVLLTDTRGKGKITTAQAIQEDADDNSVSATTKKTTKGKPKKIKGKSGKQTTTAALAQESNPAASGSGLSTDIQALVAALAHIGKGASPSQTPMPSVETTPQRQGKPYLGKHPTKGPPKEVPGVDGIMDPTKFCNYCKQKGHVVQPGDNCPNLAAHKARIAARAMGQLPQQHPEENQ